MKKISLTIFAVLLLCVVTFAGCAKADTASLLNCYDMYQGITEEYSQTGKYLYAGENNRQVDLYSQNAYNAPIYQAIQTEQGNFKILKYGNQMQVITSSSLSFYDHYDTYLAMQDIISYEDKVEQAQKSKLYRAIESLKAQCDDVVATKKALITLGYDNFNVENINVLQNLERFVKSYKKFIGNALQVSIAFEELYVQGMIADAPNSIATGEGARLYESAKLYLTKYVYLTYLQNQTDVYFDCTQEQSYKDLLAIINSQSVTYSVEPTQTEIYTYNLMCDKLSNFKTGIKNLEVAINNQESNQAYKDYIESFKTEALNFATYIKAYLLSE